MAIASRTEKIMQIVEITAHNGGKASSYLSANDRVLKQAFNQKQCIYANEITGR